MAFLGRPNFIIDSVTRRPDEKVGIVNYSFAIPLIAEALELCLARLCEDASREPMWELTAEIWGADQGEFLRGRDNMLFRVPLRPEGLGPLRVFGSTMSTDGSDVDGDAGRRMLILSGARARAEGWFNEDNPGTDEVYMRVYLSSVFTSWQVIQTIDSRILTGQFRGEPA